MFGHQIDGVEVASDILHVKAVSSQVYSKIVVSDLRNACFKIRGTVNFAEVYLIDKIADIAQPAAEILIRLCNGSIVAALIVGNIQNGYQMDHLYGIAIGNNYVAQVTQRRKVRFILLIVCCNIFNEVGVHRAGNTRPETVLILFGTGTDKVQRQSITILIIRLTILFRNRLKLLEKVKEQGIIRQSVLILITLRSIGKNHLFRVPVCIDSLHLCFRSPFALSSYGGHRDQGEQHADHEQ
ncbi:MAG: hypothetical protein IKG85_09085 [Clostridia bacterium]|nr:hypothetical protein [Clostridia bacterium]